MKGEHEKDDGKFFIDFDNYLKYFSKTHICKVRDTYEYIHKEFVYDPDYIHNFIEIKISSAGQTFFILNQKNTRIYRNTKNMSDYENEFVSFNLFEKKGSEYIFRGSACANDNRLSIELNPKEPGTYIAAISLNLVTDAHLHSDYVKFREEYKKSFTKKFTIPENNSTHRFRFVMGVYSRDRNPTIKDYIPEKENFVFKLHKEPMFNLAKANPNKHHFEEENEKESWRSIFFPKDLGGLGYLVYYNLSKGYIYEKLTFTKFINVTMTSLVDERKNLKIQLDDDLIMDNEEEQLKEDFYSSQGLLNTRVSILKNADPSIPVSEENPFIIQVITKPKDFAILLFEKTAETSGIEVKSEIMFSYPMIELLREQVFPGKKSKIKYVNKFIDIIENIIEHTNGIVFKYSNNTKNMKIGVNINFTTLDNLVIKKRENYDMNGNLQIEDDDDEETKNKNKHLEQYYDTKDEYEQDEVPLPEIKDPTREVNIIVPPGEIVILELASINRYQLYSYISAINYQVNFCKDTKFGVR